MATSSVIIRRDSMLLEDERLIEKKPLLGRGGIQGIPRRSSSQLPPLIENEEERKKRKISLWMVYLTNMLSAMGFSILITSMYQYLEDEAGAQAKAFQGFLVGAFSLGQIVGAPFWGWLSTKQGYLPIFIVSIFMRFCGNLMYALTHNYNPDVPGFDSNSSSMPANQGATQYQQHKEWYMAGSRLIVGFGAGSMAVCNAYVAGATTTEERTGAMALGAASGGVGFIMGPLIAAAFSTLTSCDSRTSPDDILINFETAPSYFACLLCILNIIFMAIFFRESRINEVPSSPSPNRPRRKSYNSRGMDLGIPEADRLEVEVESFDKTSACILLLMYFASMVAFSSMETVTVPLTMAEYGWDKQQAGRYNGYIIGGLGLESVAMFAVAKPLAQRFGERKVLVTGMVVVGMAQVFSMPLFGPPLMSRNVTNATNHSHAPFPPGPNHTNPNASQVGGGWGPYGSYYDGGYAVGGGLEGDEWNGHTYGTPGAAILGGTGNYYENYGSGPEHNHCGAGPDKSHASCDLDWCYTLPKIPLGQYLFATLFLQSAFPLANVMLFTLYSKVLGPISQGLWMGLLNSAGSAARLIGPVAIMQLFVHVGPRWMYAMVAIMLFGSCAIGLCFYKRLVPHIQQREEKIGG